MPAATIRSTPTSIASSFPLRAPVACCCKFCCVLAMAVSSLGKETEQHASHGGWERRDEWFHSLVGGTPAPDAGRAPHPRCLAPRPRGRSDAGARRTALEVLA